jgi:hypothetical protein
MDVATYLAEDLLCFLYMYLLSAEPQVLKYGKVEFAWLIKCDWQAIRRKTMRLKEYENDMVIDWARISHGVLVRQEEANCSPSQINMVAIRIIMSFCSTPMPRPGQLLSSQGLARYT